MNSLLSAENGQLAVERNGVTKVVIEETKHAISFLQRMRGLLFTKRLNFALVIHCCNAVHMMFMTYAIDVVFADKNGEILRCVSNLKPWKLSPMVAKAYFAVELPAGLIRAQNISEGDRLKVVPR